MTYLQKLQNFGKINLGTAKNTCAVSVSCMTIIYDAKVHFCDAKFFSLIEVLNPKPRTNPII